MNIESLELDEVNLDAIEAAPYSENNYNYNANAYRFGRAICLSAAAVTCVGGMVALFTTAFTTCNDVSLRNKTGDTVTVYYSWPLGTKAPAVILPYTINTIKFNGINSYVDLTTSAGTMHFKTDGGGVLKNGANNRKITNGEPSIFFWTCNKRYDSSHSQAAATHLRGSDLDWKYYDEDSKEPEYIDLKKANNSPLVANSFLKPSRQVANTPAPTPAVLAL